jgi:hypothetical protein
VAETPIAIPVTLKKMPHLIFLRSSSTAIDIQKNPDVEAKKSVSHKEVLSSLIRRIFRALS